MSRPTFDSAVAPVHPTNLSPGVRAAETLDPPPALAQPPGVESLWHALRQRWPVIIALGFLGAAIGFGAVWLVMPSKYISSVLIHLNANPPSRYEGEIEFRNFQKTQSALATSYLVIESALSKTQVRELREVQAHSDKHKWLKKDLIADSELAPEILRLTLSGDHPEELPVFLNTLADAYLNEFAQKEANRLKNRHEQLHQAHRKTSETLLNLRIDLARREKAAGLKDQNTIQQELSNLYQRKRGLEQRLDMLNQDEQKAQVELEAARTKIAAPATIVIEETAVNREIDQDPFIQKLREELVLKQRELQEFSKVGIPSNPMLIALKDQVKAIETQILAKASGMRKAIEEQVRAKVAEALKVKAADLEVQLQVIARQRLEVTGQLRAVEEEVKKLNQSLIINVPPDVQELRDQIAQTEQVQKKLVEEIGPIRADLEAVQAKEGKPPILRVAVLQPAQVPQTRSHDRKLKYATAAALAMFGAVFFGVAMMEFRLRRVYSSDDVAQGLGMNLVGTLPVLPLKARQAQTPVDAARNGTAPALPLATSPEQFALLESVDAVRTVLLHRDQTSHLQVVMITSAIMGEGKTSLSCQLAASMARANRRTLLIDADLRNPSVHKQMHTSLSPGFCDVLRGEYAIEDVIRPTDLKQMFMIPAGQMTWEAIQALSQDRLGEIFEHLRTQYETILIDTSPVMPVTDPLLLAQHADAVLFSAMKNVSRLPTLHAARHKLATLDVPVLGVVVVSENPRTYGASLYPSK